MDAKVWLKNRLLAIMAHQRIVTILKTQDNLSLLQQLSSLILTFHYRCLNNVRV